MPVTMGGMASGINTDEIIDKLINVESQPIKKIQVEKQEYQEKKQALGVMGDQLKELQKAAKELYGFRASYDDKKAISSVPGIVEASATPQAEKGIKRVRVERLAAFHKIVSDQVEADLSIPAGDFSIEVNGEKHPIRFRGGRIDALAERITEEAGKIVTAQIVNTTGTRRVLAMESKVSGERGEILLSGDKDMLKRIGLVSGQKDADKNKSILVFDTKNFRTYGGETREKEDGSLAVAPDGRSVDIKGMLWREFVLPVQKEIKKDTYLEFQGSYTAPPSEAAEEDTLPYKVETGPEDKVVIKGIELKSYNISRERPLDRKPPQKDFADDPAGIGLVYEENGQRKEKIYSIKEAVKGNREIPVGVELEGKTVSAVIFYANQGDAKFANAALVTPEKGKDLLEPKNLISKADNAKMKLDGVDVERDKNDGINDMIRGVTLNLRSAAPDTDVEIRIEHDIDKAVERIRKFVETYNKYIDLHTSFTRAGKTEKLNDFDKVKRESGIFTTDMTFQSLNNQLRMSVSNAYPSTAERIFRMFSEIGVSTGAVNSSWESIKYGKLVVDEPVLREAIMSNPDGVRNLFGSDNDGDNRIDNGLAFTVENVLDPYVRPGKNIIATKVSLQDDSIKSADERIARLQDHLKSYEEKLRKKFSTMEKSVSGSKSQRDWMNQQMGGQK